MRAGLRRTWTNGSPSTGSPAFRPIPRECPGAGEPGGWNGLAYYRWHSSPRIDYSRYDDAALAALRRRLDEKVGAETWCIFDNTASGAAFGNARALASSEIAK